MMARKLQAQSAFYFHPESFHDGYCVILVGLKNDVNGNRRYEATVVDLEDLQKDDWKADANRFRFTGHCMSERDEAKFALGLYLKG